MASEYESLRFHAALELIASLSSRGNVLMNDEAPWTLVKSEDPAEVARGTLVLTEVLEAVRICAVLLVPVTPRLSDRILAQLGEEKGVGVGVGGGGSDGGDGGEAIGPFQSDGNWRWGDAVWGGGRPGLEAGRAFPPPTPVFQRLEGEFVIGVAEKAT